MSSILRSVHLVKYLRSPIRFVRSQPLLSASFSAAAARFKDFPAHIIIEMPALSPTMEAGNVGAWKKSIGDKLAPGDVLVEIETDKATMDYEFQDEGYLAKILLDEGSKDVSIGKPLGVYVEDEDSISSFSDFTIEDAGGSTGAPKKEARKEEPQQALQTPKKDSKPASQPSSASSSPEFAAAGARVFASPLAKTLALQRGIKIAEVKGSGPNGRVIARDIELFKPAAAMPPASALAAFPSTASYEDIPISSMRSTIAKRLRQSKNEAPDFIVQSTMSVSKLLQLRASLNSASDGSYKISVNDLLVKALAVACKRVPAPNTHWLENEKVLREFRNVDVSVAVSTPKGLITPIVCNAEAKGLAEISAQTKDLAKRARDNKLKPEEFQGGTITISNMGMNNAVSMFTAIINPPQSAIIAIGTVERTAVEDPLAENGIAFDDVMNITGTFDHRVVDGAVAGEYMRALKTIVENPLQLML